MNLTGDKWREMLPRDERMDAFAASLLSLLVLAAQRLRKRWRSTKSTENPAFYFLPKSEEFTWTAIQVVAALVSFAEVAVIALLFKRYRICALGVLLVALVYSAFLYVLATFRRFRPYSLNHHAAFVQFVALIAFGYRDIVPITLGAEPIDKNYGVLIWVFIALTLYGGFIAPGLTPRHVKTSTANEERRYNPIETASPFSFLCHSYLAPTIWLAYKKSTLEVSDLPAQLPKDKADCVRANDVPLLDPLSPLRAKNIFIGLITCLRYEILATGALAFFEVLNAFAGPVATLKILGYLEADDHTGLVRPWVWIIWLAGGPVFRAFCVQWRSFIKTHAVVRLEVIFNQLVFLHALRTRVNTASADLDKRKSLPRETEPLITQRQQRNERNATPDTSSSTTEGTSEQSSAPSPDSTTAAPSRAPSPTPKSSKDPKPTSETSKHASIQAGSMSNLITVDASNLNSFLEVTGVTSVAKSIVCFILLYNVLGWSALVGCVILIATLPLPGYLIKLRTTAQKRQMKKADQRLQVVTQTMSVIRMVKLFGWEKQMEEKIAESRRAELKQLWFSQVIDTACRSLTFVFPVFVIAGAYSCFVLIMRMPLKASLIFSSISLFDMLRDELLQLSLVLPLYIEAKISLDRLTAFLNTGELMEDHSQWRTAPETSTTHGDGDIVIRNSQFAWKTESPWDPESWRSFKLRIKGEVKFVRGRVNLIVGPTGCGKTSLLMSLLGEMIHEPLALDSAWSLPRHEGVAYAAQESWVLNETIRDNILFRAEYDEARYKEVLRQCALEHDLQLFEAGDLTEVGERGITLSGGQKARITLARAVYSSAQILLLDDILSALDVHTSRWIVEQCLGGSLLKDRTILLVTHNVLLASSIAEYMVILNRNGTLQNQGSVQRLLRSAGVPLELEGSADTSPDDEERAMEDQEASAKQVVKGKQIADEELAIGHVGWPVFKLYFKALGGPLFYTCWMITVAIAVIMPIGVKAFLAYWSSQYDIYPIEEVPVVKYLAIYTTLSMSWSLVGFTAWAIYLFGVIRASRIIHEALIHSVLTSTLRWLDITPISRVLTRCSQDIAAIDRRISDLLMSVIQFAGTVIVNASTAIAVAGWQMTAPAIVTVILGLFLGRVYMAAQLPVKRFSSNAKSPIIGHIQNALVGLVSVRAYGASSRFEAELRQKLDKYVTVAIPFWDLNRWIGMRIEFLGALLSGTIAMWLVYGRPQTSSKTGFIIVTLTGFNRTLLMVVRRLNNLEVQANSLERVRDYLNIEHEPQATEDKNPPAYWPSTGDLRVENLTARYSASGPEVLKDVSFVVHSGERIGVVGRTGAGKSTMGLALLRAIPTSGKVFLDNRLTYETNLSALRAAISIIPQSPELLAGTLRENLDPLKEHDDAELYSALRAAGLIKQPDEADTETFGAQKGEGEGVAVAGIGLDTLVESSGSNFSQGQRQIIALARALVKRTKLLIMDEATSAIDYETDRIIQKFIRSEFHDATMIIVAHRLQTIMDSDKILVLDAGRVVEFGPPKELLQIEGGYLRGLVDESSDKADLYISAGAVPSQVDC